MDLGDLKKLNQDELYLNDLKYLLELKTFTSNFTSDQLKIHEEDPSDNLFKFEQSLLQKKESKQPKMSIENSFKFDELNICCVDKYKSQTKSDDEYINEINEINKDMKNDELDVKSYSIKLGNDCKPDNITKNGADDNNSPILQLSQLSPIPGVGKDDCTANVEVFRVNLKYGALNDLAGLNDVKQNLREAIIYPLMYPHLFTRGRQSWSRALLFGPPGVGKTALVQAVAAEAKLPLYQLSSSDLLSSWFGQTEKQVHDIFAALGGMRCILFMDEIDALCRRRSSTDTNQSRRLQTELMLQMENYEASPMFLIAATNCPWEVDPAFLRRFQQQVFVPLPDFEARQELFVSGLALGRLPLGWRGWTEMVTATDGLSGADIRCVVRTALMVPLRDMTRATHWTIMSDGRCMPCDKEGPKTFHCTIEDIPPTKVWCRQVTIRDIWAALNKYSRTVTADTLLPFQEFIKGHNVCNNNSPQKE